MSPEPDAGRSMIERSAVPFVWGAWLVMVGLALGLPPGPVLRLQIRIQQGEVNVHPLIAEANELLFNFFWGEGHMFPLLCISSFALGAGMLVMGRAIEAAVIPRVERFRLRLFRKADGS